MGFLDGIFKKKKSNNDRNISSVDYNSDSWDKNRPETTSYVSPQAKSTVNSNNAPKETLSSGQADSYVEQALIMIKTDERKAYALFKKASDAGSLRGTAYYYFYYCMEYYGRNDSSRVSKGIKQLEECYNKGCVEAPYLLGELYNYTFDDDYKSTYWYKKGADKGHLPSIICYSDALTNGCGIERDTLEAYDWLKKVPENYNGVESDSYNMDMGMILMDSEFYEDAIKHFKKIGPNDPGYDSVCYFIGRSYYHLNDIDSAKKYLNIGIQHGSEICAKYLDDINRRR